MLEQIGQAQSNDTILDMEGISESTAARGLSEVRAAPAFSPSQPKVASIADLKQVKFNEALTWLLDRSKAITRPSWNGDDASDYAYIGDDGFLMIHRSTGEHLFSVHESDIRGIDWVVMAKPQVAAPSTPPVHS